jgi:isoamylase
MFLSQGVPMLLAGDEFGRTQRGNNNAYCQDNAFNWLDWNSAASNASLVEFVRHLVDLRKSRLWLRRDTFLKGTRRGDHAKDVTWLHPSGREMVEADWNDSNLRAIAVLMNGAPKPETTNGDLLVVFNADEAPIEMTLPRPPQGEAWTRLFDTSLEQAGGELLLRCNEILRVDQRSTILLESVPA